MGFLDWIFGRRNSDDASLEQKEYQRNTDTSISHNAQSSDKSYSRTYVVSNNENPNPHTVHLNMDDYPVELTQEEAQLLEQGQILQAIKLVRERLDTDLATAKFAVDAYKDGETDINREPTPKRADEVELTSEEIRLIRSGETVQAIKLVHERAGLTLVNAKRIVDQYRQSI
ncbi:hypothetical protein EJ419_00270 [Alloscardovia theropitheci]|uniref:Ribosomal protein L7/L12 C-terminal domain-containing protein n=1 Tax=Alloscardovia theropitheci TaxID=2496842 RepID=A0A4R0QRR3_9BIFI|nr:hypothetical protein [Alloscardovia theropitheci]TCD55072.1 hypothetical protein EJ419_00270 [Alloscardovia theropitheci]